jgi:hypothetical protein
MKRRLIVRLMTHRQPMDLALYHVLATRKRIPF